MERGSLGNSISSSFPLTGEEGSTGLELPTTNVALVDDSANTGFMTSAAQRESK